MQGCWTVVYLLIPTSNHNVMPDVTVVEKLFISWFLHQTTTSALNTFPCRCCLSLDSYIKPQPARPCREGLSVVYLLIPTSNHNLRFVRLRPLFVVYLLIPTSNHNHVARQVCAWCVVYLLIPTSNHNRYGHVGPPHSVVYLLIPTSNHNQRAERSRRREVVYLLIPTSNHNLCCLACFFLWLFISWFLHQTTTFCQ